MKSTNQSTVSRWIWTNENASLRCSFLTHRDAGYVCGQGLEVVEGGGGVPDDEVDGDEEAAEDDTEAAADDGQEDVLLEEDAVPRPAAAGVRRAAAARSDRNTCNENIFG